ncbi:MAG TPA: GNAT family N-acetyltransferase [Caulobacteraceae bacterium]
MPGARGPLIREAAAADMPAVAAIYGHHVLTGFGTFEEVPPTAEALSARVATVRALGLPYLVAELDGEVAGFAYASSFRPRAAYRFTAEDTVYVRPDALGQGVGRALLGEIIARCEALGLRQLMAIIGDSGNAASIGLHRAMGFSELGVGRDVGFKRGRWLDIVWMQKTLANADGAAPRRAGRG